MRITHRTIEIVIDVNKHSQALIADIHHRHTIDSIRDPFLYFSVSVSVSINVPIYCDEKTTWITDSIRQRSYGSCPIDQPNLNEICALLRGINITIRVKEESVWVAGPIY